MITGQTLSNTTPRALRNEIWARRGFGSTRPDPYLDKPNDVGRTAHDIVKACFLDKNRLGPKSAYAQNVIYAMLPACTSALYFRRLPNDLPKTPPNPISLADPHIKQSGSVDLAETKGLGRRCFSMGLTMFGPRLGTPAIDPRFNYFG
ncbi:hypothetical protein AG1IA_09081 [Rhizoctonia solani AG-1 IA]|uniref:Uncharacterized protein n=1 Tax=Thanatephorus cucumeris (strain AG1-IA) TaxID=983506 RepID=L8WKK4_THACA|nr:hypothetical protein AG1IA_09081 [Rhizoctonia solani AG-1 IA]